MNFIKLGNEMLNLAQVDRVVFQYDATGKPTSATVHIGHYAALTYHGTAAEALSERLCPTPKSQSVKPKE